MEQLIELAMAKKGKKQTKPNPQQTLIQYGTTNQTGRFQNTDKYTRNGM